MAGGWRTVAQCYGHRGSHKAYAWGKGGGQGRGDRQMRGDGQEAAAGSSWGGDGANNARRQQSGDRDGDYEARIPPTALLQAAEAAGVGLGGLEANGGGQRRALAVPLGLPS